MIVYYILLLGLVCGNAEAEDWSNILTLKQRIDIFGTKSSYELPAIELVNSQRSKKREPNTLQYRLKFEGEDIVLTLKQNKELLAPGCVVHHHQRNGYKIIYPCAKGKAHCFYTGRSDAHPDSWVAVNTCHGLKGMFSIRNTSHVIAPLNGKQLGYYDNPSESYNDTNVVYRFTGDKTLCKTQELLQSIKAVTSERTKRADHQTKYIEASVVIDPSVNDFYGYKSEEYIQTTFNIASKLYEHQSIGSRIKLGLSEIHIYESYDNISVPITLDAQQTLNSFCSWHSKVTTTNPDCTILYTRLDLSFQNDPETVGLALGPEMCNKGRNCAIVQDTGPASGVTLAHEIGHLLGMRHDDETPCGSYPGVMIPGATGEAAYRWSSCSARALQDFLRTPKAQCLANMPPRSTYSPGYNNSAPLPGTLYDKDEQCRLLFGNQSSYCYDMLPNTGEVCGNLLCRQNATSICVYMSQVLDGSDCNNTRSWCMSSECVAMGGNGSVLPIDGAWSTWDESYSPCSTTCGGGVKVKRRSCINPRPRYGGKPCTGISIKAALCNMQACSNSYSDTLCSELNNNSNLTSYGLWRHDPSYIIGDSCEIYCKAGGSVVKRPDAWLQNDGVECEPGHDAPFGRCIDHKCRRFGCDGVMDSGMVYDKCGVCNGTDSGCQRVYGKYNSNSATVKSFTRVLVVPRGSYGVKIEEKSQYCYLGALVNGTRVINPDISRQTLSGTYKVGGTKIHYQRHPEKIEIAGPTTGDVEIQVYRFYYLRPDIDYEYYRQVTSLSSMFRWSTRWAPCTKSCGTGYEVPAVQCVDLSSQPVADYHCDLAKKPSETWRKCNDHFCPPVWKTLELESCSVTCGPGGVRQRKVHCVKENDGQEMTVMGSCDQHTRPPSIVNCSLVSCPGIWNATQWAPCSKTCGEGLQRRNVRCVDPADYTPTEERFCTRETRPEDQRTCFNEFCPGNPFGPECKNKEHSCKERYGQDICYGTYSPWAAVNCMKECRICSPDDEPRCQILEKQGRNPCVTYKDWAAVNCRKLCKECVDDLQCQGYVDKDFDICSHTIYSKIHCPKMCGFCGECLDDPDVPCHTYDVNQCGQVYMKYMCKKRCGVC